MSAPQDRIETSPTNQRHLAFLIMAIDRGDHATIHNILLRLPNILAAPDVEPQNRLLPVLQAVKKGEPKIVKELMYSGGADSFTFDNVKFLISISEEQEQQEIGFFLQRCILIRGIADNNLDQIKYALEKGVDINSQGEFGSYPLHFAAKNSSAEVVRFLLSNGASPASVDMFDRTPLMLAQDEKRADIVEELKGNRLSIANETLRSTTPQTTSGRRSSDGTEPPAKRLQQPTDNALEQN
jgi:ankyrin repeat protein